MLEERAKRSLELDRRGKGVPSVRLCLSGSLLWRVKPIRDCVTEEAADVCVFGSGQKPQQTWFVGLVEEDCVASDWIRGGISGILMESEQNGIFGE